MFARCSFMAIFAMTLLALSEQGTYNWEKCSIEYIRSVIMASCRDAVGHRQDDPENTLMELPNIDPALLPKGAIVEKIPYNRSSRAASTKYNEYFHYCCEHPEICENLPCIV